MKRIVALAAVSVAMLGMAETFYWQNATKDLYKPFDDIGNWRVFGQDDAPAVVPGSYDSIDFGTTTNSLLHLNFDLCGREWTVASFSNVLAKDWVYHYVGISNGTLNVTQGYYAQSKGLYTTVADTGTLKVCLDPNDWWGQSGIWTSFFVKPGGKLHLTGTKWGIYFACMNVDDGGEVHFEVPELGWNETSAQANGITNNGTFYLPNGFKLKSPWAMESLKGRNPSFGMTQAGGTFHLGGDFTLTRQNDIGPDTCVTDFRFKGGKLVATCSPTFAGVRPILGDGAALELDVSAGNVFDLSLFSGGTGTTIRKTGAGAVKVAASAPCAVQVDEGVFIADDAAALVPSSVSLAEGATIRLAAVGFSFDGFPDYAKYAYELDMTVFPDGQSVFTATDAAVRRGVVARMRLPGGVSLVEDGAAVKVAARTAPVVSTWTGAAGDGKWTTRGNWDVDVPGIHTNESGVVVGTAADEAVFSTAATSQVIDLTGLLVVSNVTVTGASAPVYQFGTAVDQVLRLEVGGTLKVTADVPVAPILFAKFGCGRDRAGTAGAWYIENNSTELAIPGYGYGINYSSWAADQLYLRGTGSFKLDGAFAQAGSHATRIFLENTYDPSTDRGTVTINADLNLHKLLVQGGSASRKIVITAGHKLSFKTGGSYDINYFDRDTLVTGEGTIEFSSQKDGGVKGIWANGTTSVASGKTVTIDCRIAACGSSTPPADFKPGIRSVGSGYLVLAGENVIEGEIMQIGSGRIVTGSIGAPGVASAFGLGGTVVVGDGAWLKYTGAGETTSRTLVLTNGIAHLEQAGTGDWTVAMPFANRASAGKLYLTNTKGSDGVFHDGVCSTPITDGTGPLQLFKTDAGRWILTGANTFTGATRIEGGVLRLEGAGSLASSSGVTVTDGATLDCATGAAASLKSLTVEGGANVVKVAAGTTLTLDAVVRTGSGTVDIVTDDDSAAVKVKGMTVSSEILPWLTINGRSAGFDDDGRIVKRLIRIDTAIAAKGGVIPNDATKNVGVTTVGNDGHVTLANGESAAVAALVQATTVKAEVEIPAGKTLTAGGLYAEEGAAALQVGGFGEDGTLVANGTTFTLYPEGRDSEISVRAPVSVPAGTKILKQGDGVARLSGSGLDAWTGTAEIEKGTLSVSNATALAATLSGNGAFELAAGAQPVTLSKAQTGFSGTFKVAAGTVKPTIATAFGANNAKSADVVVASNAVVDLTGFSSDPNFVRRGFVIAGEGSLALPSSRNIYFDHLSLYGDAAVDGLGSGKYMHTRGAGTSTPAVADYGGHTLVKKGLGCITFQDMIITNAGKIVIDDVAGAQKNGLVLYRNTNLGTEEDPPIVMGNGAVIYLGTSFNPGSKPYRRPLEVVGTNATLNTWACGRATNENSWAGPIALKNDDSQLILSTYEKNNNNQVTVLGPISGPGSVLCNNHSRIVLANPSNTYTGTTRLSGISNTSLFLAYPGSLPDYSKLTIENGRVAVCYKGDDDPAHWQKPDILALANAATCTTTSSENYPKGVVAVDASEAPGGTCAISLADADITNDDFGIGVDGGRVELSGETTKIETLGAYRGTLAITGGTHAFDRAIATSDGTNETGVLSFEGGSTTFSTDIIAGMITWDDICLGRIRVANATLASATTPEDGGGIASVKLGYRRNSGILEIGSGANVTANLWCGAYSDDQPTSGGSYGAVHMNGGAFTVWSTTDLASYYAAGLRSYAFLGLSDGAYEQSGPCHLNAYGAKTVESCGLVYQSGGTFRHNKRGSDSANRMWRIGGSRDSVTTVYRTGGTMKVDGQIYLVNQSEAFTNNFVQWTQGAGCGRAECDHQFILAANNDAHVVLNLNGGTLAAKQFYKYRATDNSVHVNFDGGEAEIKASTAIFGPVAGESGEAVDRVTVFGGGAKIAVASNCTATLDTPLQAPQGNGVVSIPAPAWSLSDGRTFVGPPAVWIKDEGGAGYGASAIVEYDAATCRPGAVVITSPGCNYTNPKAYFRYGTNVWTSVCSVGETAATGGFTKTGEGTLVLNAANTYGGATTVEDGVLKIGSADAIPSGSQLILRGGMLDPNSFDVDLANAVFAGGGVKGDVTLPTALSVDFDRALAGKPMRIDGVATIVPGTVLTVNGFDATKLEPGKKVTLLETEDVVGADNLSVAGIDALPSGCTLEVFEDGKKVRLNYRKGLILMVR